eukprot:355830-Ditylum_brightwellii.AAC.1
MVTAHGGKMFSGLHKGRDDINKDMFWGNGYKRKQLQGKNKTIALMRETLKHNHDIYSLRQQDEDAFKRTEKNER